MGKTPLPQSVRSVVNILILFHFITACLFFTSSVLYTVCSLYSQRLSLPSLSFCHSLYSGVAIMHISFLAIILVLWTRRTMSRKAIESHCGRSQLQPRLRRALTPLRTNCKVTSNKRKIITTAACWVRWFMYLCVCASVYVQVCMCKCVCASVYVQVCMCKCVCASVYVQVCMWVYVHGCAWCSF